LPFECQKIAKKFLFLITKYCDFFFKWSKMVFFYQKIAGANFLGKITIFGNFLKNKWQVLGNFLTFKLQFSRGLAVNC